MVNSSASSTRIQPGAFGCDLLVVSPHPDDAELFCGGLLLSMARKGYRCAVVDLSEAELSTYGSLEERRRETERASQILGLAARENIGLPNCRFHEFYESTKHPEKKSPEGQSAVLAVVSVFRRLRPKVAVLPYARDRHPDHVEAGRICTRALFLSGLARFESDGLSPHTPEQALFYSFRTQFIPSFIVDISHVQEDKYRAIETYRSQMYPPASEQSRTLLASERSLDALRARDGFFGAQIGVAAGEGYLSRTMVRIDDPIAHASFNPTSLAMFFPDLGD